MSIKLRHLKKKRVLSPVFISVIIAFPVGFWVGGLSPTVDLEIREREHQLGTDNSAAFRFHAIVEDHQGYGLRFPGYIIGVEKTNREKVQAEDTSMVLDTSMLTETQKDWAGSRLDDEEVLFVSHILKYSLATKPIPHVRSDFFYNAYAKEEQGPAFSNGFQSCLRLQQDLDAMIVQHQASHVILVCMGWMTDQQESIRDCNSIIGHLLEEKKGDDSFKPIVIHISWPSHSDIDVVNYPIKADDADELGLHWIQTLLRKTIKPLRIKHKLHVSCISHSLGARAMASGIFLHLPDDQGPLVDLLVCFGGAFSINRFLGSDGVEGGPYQDLHQQAANCVLTFTKSDMMTAFPSVYNTPHVGGYPASEIAALHPEHFIMCKHNELTNIQYNDHRIVYVDLSDIMKHNSPQRSSGAHGDLFRADMAQFLTSLYNRFGIIIQ